jgi:addiction module HigA family antidote
MATYTKKRPERRPTHPGAILKRMWLDELGYTQSDFADALVDASPKKVKKSTMQTKLNELINGKRAMSADFAVLIGKVLNTSPRMWMNLQTNLDIWEAEEKVDAA